MKKITEYLPLILLIIIILWGWFTYRDSQETKAEIKDLRENVNKIVNYDSIISGIERKMLDSVKVVSDHLEQFKTLQHDENTKLRKRNAALEKRFRDIDITDRPSY